MTAQQNLVEELYGIRKLNSERSKACVCVVCLSHNTQLCACHEHEHKLVLSPPHCLPHPHGAGGHPHASQHKQQHGIAHQQHEDEQREISHAEECTVLHGSEVLSASTTTTRITVTNRRGAQKLRGARTERILEGVRGIHLHAC